ncbi:MAG: iron-containing alcohol dehydrogenase [Promicromonosporaceae bacterium]|nr:iron-containing alcohol dehydrogenase [Promicromonosporaceae bacterium]
MRPDDTAPPVLRWGGGATWWAGADALEQALQGALERGGALRPPGGAGPGGALRLVADAAVVASGDGRSLRDRVAAVATTHGCALHEWRHDASRPLDIDDVERASSAWARDPADVVVLLGGGSTIDLGVLALLPDAERALLRAPGRSGLVLLSEAPRPRPVTVAVPTTLGTGAEMSAAACVEHDGKRLVVGAWLRPDVAVCDPRATAGLPAHLVREAVVEVAARLVVPFASRWQAGVVHPLTHVLGDETTQTDLRVLLRLADALATSDAATPDELTRMAIAAVSAHSHGGWANVGRASFSSPVWFVATELAHVLGISKSAATALLLPAWTDAVLAGERAWGDAGRLRALAAGLGCEGPVEMIDRVCALLPAPGRGGADDADEVAYRCMRRWGGGLPILAGITSRDVAGLVGASLATRRMEATCLT